MKKALILDLDNTIYPVSSVGNAMFGKIFDEIESSGEYKGDFSEIRMEIMRTPFQKVARIHEFSDRLIQEGINLLQHLDFGQPMSTFDDYPVVKKIGVPRFLVTSGFKVFQQSKVRQLGIREDFKEIHIVDPMDGDRSKKDVFRDILDRYDYKPEDILVVGDDPSSEIEAALELGMEAVLYDRIELHTAVSHVPRITHMKKILPYFESN